MSDTDNKPTLGRKPLGLKRSVEAGEVKQTFSHGRTNKVVVEVKRRKIVKPGAAPEGAPAAQAPAAVEPTPAPASAPDVQSAAEPVAPAAPAPAETSASSVIAAKPGLLTPTTTGMRPSMCRQTASTKARDSPPLSFGASPIIPRIVTPVTPWPR